MTTRDTVRKPDAPPVAATGVQGLDAILAGGLPREEMHLLQGSAGTGKTTIALQFLTEGVRQGESVLYVTLSQSKAHLERIARSHGWSLEGMAVHEMSPGNVAQRIAARQTILPSVEVELGEAFAELVELVGEVRPRRAVIDSITIVQLLAGSAARYHREVVNLRQLFVERGCTLLVLADHPAVPDEGLSPEVIFHPLSGCVIMLEQAPRPYGDVRRRLRVVKARGVAQDGGYHDLKILTGRMEVYARLGAYRTQPTGERRVIPTYVEGLDRMLAGGLPTGSSCLIVGPSGVGKSSVAALHAASVNRAGENAAIFLFDERPETYIVRSENVGIGLQEHIDAGRLLVRQIDPGEIAPGEFARQVRDAVLERSLQVVIVDSVIGYFAAMGAADVLLSQLHELMTFLTRQGVLMVLCGAQESFMSIGRQQAVDVSYLSDAILVLRFFEAEGQLRRALAVVKKKHGPHASTIHELYLEDRQIRIGAEPLRDHTHLMVPSTCFDATPGPPE